MRPTCLCSFVTALALVLSAGTAKTQSLSYEGDWQTSSTGVEPWGIAVRSGRIYVTGATGAPCVQVFGLDGTPLLAWGVQGAGPGQFNTPYAVAVGPAGEVVIADSYNDRIQVFDSMGNLLNHWGVYGRGAGQFNSPTGVAVASDGSIFVADHANNRVQVFNSDGTWQRQWATASPYGLALDQVGNVYVTGWSPDLVTKYSSTGELLLRFGSLGRGPGQFVDPTGIAVGTAGTVYVADNSNLSLQEFAPSGGFVAEHFGFWNIIGVATDLGRLYVVDTSRHRIAVYRAEAPTLAANTSWGRLKQLYR